MRIFTWNVRYRNPNIITGLKYILSFNPDVICFQEFPAKFLNFLDQIPYYKFRTEDFQKSSPIKNGYIITLSKHKPFKKEIINYYNKPTHTPLSYIYRTFTHSQEIKNATFISVKVNNLKLSVVNARLSASVSGRIRLKQLENLLKTGNRNTIFAGDFNIVDGTALKLLTGWARGYDLSDYLTTERKQAENIFLKHNLTNIFSRIRTSVAPFPHLQFDHIMTPKSYTVVKFRRHPKTYFSDHYILSAEIKSN